MSLYQQLSGDQTLQLSIKLNAKPAALKSQATLIYNIWVGKDGGQILLCR